MPWCQMMCFLVFCCFTVFRWFLFDARRGVSGSVCIRLCFWFIFMVQIRNCDHVQMLLLLFTCRDTEAFPVTTGSINTCSVVDHELYCWGRNHRGQLGRGNTDDLYQVPDSPVNLGTNFEVESVECALEHCCAVSTTEDMKCSVFVF